MNQHLTPIMIGILAATLPAYPVAGFAAELGQVDVSDPAGGTQITLESGATVTHAGAGAAVNVSGAGNKVTGDGIRISAGGAGGQNTPGVKVSQGGAAELSNGSVKTVGTGQYAHALHATGAGSTISAANTEISTAGSYSHGAYAQSGGKVALKGGSVTLTNYGSTGLRSEGANSLVTAEFLDITTAANNNAAVYVDNGGRVELTGVNANVQGNTIDAMTVSGAASTLSLKDTHVISVSGRGIEAESGTLVMEGGSVTAAGDAIMANSIYGVKGGSVTVSDATLSSSNGYGINLNADGASAKLRNVSISATRSWGAGIWLIGVDSQLDAVDLHIDSQSLGIDNRRGRATLQGGSIITRGNNAYGLYASREGGTKATIETFGTSIQTQGVGSVGALARVSGASIALTDSTVDTYGVNAHGLFSSGTSSKISATGSIVRTRGADATGVAMSNRTLVMLDNTRLSTEGADAYGIWSYVTGADITNTLFLSNGSRVDTQDAAALLVTGGNHDFTLRDAQVTARKGGVENGGLLLHTRAVNVTSGGTTTTIEAGQVKLDATGSTLTGDVLADSGVVDISLKNASVLTGALISRDGRIDRLGVDATSTWNVRGDSSFGTLSNSGIVSFVAPDAHAGFKTVTVNDYVGGGTLVMNTRLGDDASLTDKLVIDGGSTSGTTAMRIVNAGGAGGQTTQGIRLVETINGGTTTADAFRLDAGSTGYRGSAGTIAINGYDYSLVRGGTNGVASDWYLTSIYTPGGEVDPETPEPPVTEPGGPGEPGGPLTPPEITPPGGEDFVNVSPESGAYLGNQLAATRMFMHSLHDRAVTRIPSGDAADKSGDALWARVKGSHDSGLRLTQGKVDVDTDSYVMQLGGDVLHARAGQEGVVLAGVMAGYGDARANSTSRLMLPGSNASVNARARGKVTGYSVGVYATAYANDATRLGAYADSSLQYARYSNQISSELGSARYHANAWMASVETGYAVQPFAPGSALAAMVVEPQVQVAYVRYDAADATLPGMKLESGSANSVTTRVGARVYPLGKSEASATVRPFLEANWLHTTGTPRVEIGDGRFSAKPLRDAAELKVGAEGRIGKSLYLAGQVSGVAGSGDQRGFGGMLNLTYRW
ncbi:autotransporter outer membrane beta-barrel domain-containing protein [Achromobacter sp.]|uniref:autotransporter family protein n=1 Tax=Achromobacter sp. TaxID=134375 RepID=UPI002F932F4C